jgi:hypothetical protein
MGGGHHTQGINWSHMLGADRCPVGWWWVWDVSGPELEQAQGMSGALELRPPLGWASWTTDWPLYKCSGCIPLLVSLKPPMSVKRCPQNSCVLATSGRPSWMCRPTLNGSWTNWHGAVWAKEDHVAVFAQMSFCCVVAIWLTITS